MSKEDKQIRLKGSEHHAYAQNDPVDPFWNW
jgi:hypothetical protein